VDPYGEQAIPWSRQKLDMMNLTLGQAYQEKEGFSVNCDWVHAGPSLCCQYVPKPSFLRQSPFCAETALTGHHSVSIIDLFIASSWAMSFWWHHIVILMTSHTLPYLYLSITPSLP